VVFFSPSIRMCWDSALKLGHDRFVSNPFQFIADLSYFHSTLCSLILRERRIINNR